MIRLKRLYAHNFKQLSEIELHFPDAARILVQGKNEAGKSTLFEAVFFALFGGGLATESGTRSLDGLIAYDTEKARVELDVACGDRLFKIARTIVRDKANIWELDVARGDLPPEEIRGNQAVNKRLIAELGFDGEALLNTCFVEQKKLEKLEGLSKAKREESLAKLLNLDAVVDLENSLKLRAEDRQELERLRKRAELAGIQSELPTGERELSSVENKLHLVELRRAVDGAVQEMRAVQQLDAQVCDLISQREKLGQTAERVEALKEGMQHVKEARDTVERLAENARDLERLKNRHAEALSATQEAQVLEERAKALAHLGHRLERLAQIRDATAANAKRAEELARTRTRLTELKDTLTREQDNITHVERAVRDYQAGEVLGRWVSAREAIVTQDGIETPIREKHAERDRLSGRFRIEIYGLALLLLFFVLGAVAFQSLLPLLVGLAAVTLIVLAIRATLLWRELARMAEELGQLQGRARADLAENEKRIEELRGVERRLIDMGLVVPETPDLALSQRVELARSLNNRTGAELQAEQQGARERLGNARAVLSELEQQLDVKADGIEPELARVRQVVQKAESVLTHWQSITDTRAQALAVEPGLDAVHQAIFQVHAQAEQCRQRALEAKRIEQEIFERQGQAEALATRAREAFEHANALRVEPVAWTETLTPKDYNAFGKELRAEYDALGGDAVVKQARQVEGELGRRQGERETRAKNAAALVGQAPGLLREMGRGDEFTSPPKLEEWEDFRERFRSIDLGNEEQLRIQQRELVGRVHSLRDRRNQLERELGLDGVLLDGDACRAECDDKARQMLVRERGAEIVSIARRRIVQKVLPATMDYMRVILPTLTRDRYHDAQLDPDSYKIQVWDERAGSVGSFREKNIFSGGTKDQFSLALRLAFALATLPQERGTAPSFIFLDEPLSSFDQERAEALIYLLTEGEIAHAFDQIFLISHVHVDERLFTHRVVLENGRVAFSDLP